MKIYEIITEEVRGQFLYHSTRTLDNAIKLIKSGHIKPFTAQHGYEFGRETPVISLSRNQYYQFPRGSGVVQFVIDKNALKTKGVNIKPFSFGGKGFDAEEESEKPIPVKFPFVVAVQVSPDIIDQIPKEIEKILKTNGIKIDQLSKPKSSPISYTPLHNWPTNIDNLTVSLRDNRYAVTDGKSIVCYGFTSDKTAQKWIEQFKLSIKSPKTLRAPTYHKFEAAGYQDSSKIRIFIPPVGLPIDLDQRDGYRLIATLNARIQKNKPYNLSDIMKLVTR